MIPEIGHFILVMALPTAVLLAGLPLYGYFRHNAFLANTGVFFSSLQLILIATAFGFLTYSFLNDDFTVSLVANHSNTALPVYYKFSAVWGNHEGSLLLWVLLLAVWTWLVGVLGKSLPLDIHSLVMSTLGFISIGFVLFILFTSNPFERDLLSPPQDGADLNPLLQDIGLILHPPILYIGYVGFAVAFAFAVAALITGKMDAAWARWSRPWTNAAWAFLTFGIALGSWWAYYELGWGGWWFWDPVENASFMPWLAGTALIHSLAASEKRGVFRSWTLLLAILAFSLSLLGTFLVRSGILVSVHAFAADPTRGVFILAFLFVVVGGSLLLYGFRATSIRSTAQYEKFSRETLLLINNLIFSVALLVVLLGTLFPLIMKSLDQGSYSVGPPYFNALFVPLMVPAIILMAIAPFVLWQRTKVNSFKTPEWFVVAISSILLSVAIIVFGGYTSINEKIGTLLYSFFTAWLFSWLSIATLFNVYKKASAFSRFSLGIKRLSLSYWAMIVAHLGMAVTALGIGFTSLHSTEEDYRMGIGDAVDMGGYQFAMTDISQYQASNYTATVAVIRVSGIDGNTFVLKPEKRFYHAAQNFMTEAGIHASLARDLYVSMGERFDNGDWAVKLQVKPMVRLIWLGSAMMGVGALMTLFDKRYRLSQRPKKANVTGVDDSASTVGAG